MEDGLIFAYALDGNGGGRKLVWPDIRAGGDQCNWIHLERAGHAGRQWVENESGVDPLVADALYGKPGVSFARWLRDSHPHIVAYNDGVIVHLRGVNLNPGADPNDMISIRAWIAPNQFITVRERKVWAIRDIRSEIEEGNGPTGPAAFLIALVTRLVDRIAEALIDLNDDMDALEEKMIAKIRTRHQQELTDLRRRAIAKRRHLVPQREAMRNLAVTELDWFSSLDRKRLEGLTNQLAQQVDDVEDIRERTAVMQDEILNQLATQSNRTMYVLAVVATVFLPISFLTGLFGVNLGGIPGQDLPWAFALACAVAVLLVLFEVWLFRRLKWF